MQLVRIVQSFADSASGIAYGRGKLYLLDDATAGSWCGMGLAEKLDALPIPEVRDITGAVIDYPAKAEKPAVKKGNTKGKIK